MNKTHKVNLLDFGLTKLETFFETLNEKPFRAKQILKWFVTIDNFEIVTLNKASFSKK